MQTSLYDPLSVATAQAAMTPAPKPKFVEGTVYQLARALYEVHTAYESLPASAIQDTMQRMSDCGTWREKRQKKKRIVIPFNLRHKEIFKPQLCNPVWLWGATAYQENS